MAVQPTCSSLLALDVDEVTYNSGLIVLTDILRDFKVPGRMLSPGLLRLGAVSRIS